MAVKHAIMYSLFEKVIEKAISILYIFALSSVNIFSVMRQQEQISENCLFFQQELSRNAHPLLLGEFQALGISLPIYFYPKLQALVCHYGCLFSQLLILLCVVC